MLQSSLLSKIAFLEHGFLNAEESEDAYERRELFRLTQVHGSYVFPVKEALSYYPEADGAVTDKADIYLSLRTADCVPVLFASCRDKIIGVAHAGWKGALGGIIENTIDAMASLGARRQDIYAAIGPCIFQESYEVKEDFYYACITRDSQTAAYFSADKKHFDLPGYVQNKLRNLGIGKTDFCGVDTFTHSDFLSFRRNKEDMRRNISYIGLKNQGSGI